MLFIILRINCRILNEISFNLRARLTRYELLNKNLS